MQSVQIEAYGKPWDVVGVTESPQPPPPGDGEVRLALEYAPIHPADLLLMRGFYGVRPVLPAVLGSEGVAIVEAAGAGVALSPGDRVLIANKHPAWRERMTVTAEGLFALPSGIDPKQLSMAMINPVTAHLMLTEFGVPSAGDWIIQNAANSAVGRAVIAIARARNIRTVNVVRRPELVEELKSLGGDVVLTDGPDLAKRVAEATGKAKIRVGLDGVAGEALMSLTGCVCEGGVIAVYAGMSAQPGLAFPPHLIFRDLTLKGFWLIKWLRTATPAQLAVIERDLLPLLASGALSVPVEATYPLREAKTAISHAAKAKAKVLFRGPAASAG